MLIGIKVDETRRPMTLPDRIDHALMAADAGFASVWSAPHAEWDGLTALAVIGRDVPGIALGTAIVPTYPRHPLVLASQALMIQAAIGDRFTLGVGPGAAFFIEDNFGYSYGRPGRHTREYLSALAPLLRGESVAYAGETLRVEGKVDVPGARPPSLLLSALGPVMLRIAGELADGTVTTLTGPRGIAGHVVPTISRAAADAGRPSPRVVAEALVSVTADEDGTRAWFAERFGFLARMPSYRATLDREGVAGYADIAIVGDEAAVERELRRYADAGATELIACPFGPEADRARTVEVLATLARAGSLTPAHHG